MAEHAFTRVSKFLETLKSEAKEARNARKSVDEEIWGIIVGTEIAKHTKVTQFKKSLLVTADSSIWAHAINQKKSKLIDLLVTEGFAIDSIEIKIKPVGISNEPLAANSSETFINIDQKSSQLLYETASELKSESLAQALRRLSAYSKKKEQ